MEFIRSDVSGISECDGDEDVERVKGMDDLVEVFGRMLAPGRNNSCF